MKSTNNRYPLFLFHKTRIIYPLRRISKTYYEIDTSIRWSDLVAKHARATLASLNISEHNERFNNNSIYACVLGFFLLIFEEYKGLNELSRMVFHAKWLVWYLTTSLSSKEPSLCSKCKCKWDVEKSLSTNAPPYSLML